MRNIYRVPLYINYQGLYTRFDILCYIDNCILRECLTNYELNTVDGLFSDDIEVNPKDKRNIYVLESDLNESNSCGISDVYEYLKSEDYKLYREMLKDNNMDDTDIKIYHKKRI